MKYFILYLLTVRQVILSRIIRLIRSRSEIFISNITICVDFSIDMILFGGFVKSQAFNDKWLHVS